MIPGYISWGLGLGAGCAVLYMLYNYVSGAGRYRNDNSDNVDRFIDRPSPPTRSASRPCSLCTSQSRDCMTRLTCRHMFHIPCLQEWLDRNSVCPICRRDLSYI